MNEQILITGNQLKRIFDTAKAGICKDGKRPNLEYIKLEIGKEEITSISLDGFKMNVLKTKLQEHIKNPFVCYIKPFAVDKGVKQIILEIVDDNLEMVLSHSNGSIEKRLFKQRYIEYPKWEMFMFDYKDNIKISFSARALIELLTNYKKFFDGVVTFYVKGGNSPLVMVGNDKLGNIETLLLPLM